MKATLMIAGALLVVLFAVLWIRSLLKSDEERIRALLESMADGFNRSRAGDCVEGLAEDFRDDTQGADRDSVRLALVHLFFTERHPNTKEFLLRVELPVEDLRVELFPGDELKASVELVARFYKSLGDAEKLGWEVRIEADLEKGEEGWRIQRTRHETIEGRMRF